MTTVTFEGDRVVATSTTMQPARRELSLTEAFAGSGQMLFVRDPDRLVEVLRELAARLGELPGRDGARGRYWRAWTPREPARFIWTWARGGGREPVPCWLEVEGGIARRPDRGMGEVAWQTLDDLFVHGPTQPGIPADVRAALIAHLGGDPADAFPRIDHAAIAYRAWTWDVTDDGESGASLNGAAVVIGYQYRQDMGWGEYAAERVLTRAHDIYLRAPPTACDELYAALASAVVP